MISYLVTVCNEHEELKALLTQLSNNIVGDEEVVVLYDEPNTTLEVKLVIEEAKSVLFAENVFKAVAGELNGNFAAFKNYGNRHCSKSWICQVDADELFVQSLIETLPDIIQNNESKLELIYLPRINTVQGITKAHIVNWNWSISKNELVKTVSILDTHSDYFKMLTAYDLIIDVTKGYSDGEHAVHHYEPIINYPDYQSRVYRNRPGVYWEGEVHERIVGVTAHGAIPAEYSFSLLHSKTIQRQEKQNSFYNTLMYRNVK